MCYHFSGFTISAVCVRAGVTLRHIVSVSSEKKKMYASGCEKQKITQREQMQGDKGMFPSTITVFYDLIKDKTQTSRPENICDVHM